MQQKPFFKQNPHREEICDLCPIRGIRMAFDWQMNPKGLPCPAPIPLHLP